MRNVKNYFNEHASCNGNTLHGGLWSCTWETAGSCNGKTVLRELFDEQKRLKTE